MPRIFKFKRSRFDDYTTALGVIFYALYIVVIMLAVYGYFANIFKLIGGAMGGSELGLMMILRIIGIFAVPLGAILGFF